MSIITEEISQQSFELIALKIGAIIKTELNNQFNLSAPSNPLLNATVYLERFVPMGDEEEFVVNVLYVSSDFENEDALQTNEINKYYIQVETVGAHSDEDGGDTVAMANLKRLIGVIRAILMNSKYYRLGFNDPIIVQKRVLKSIQVSEPRNHKDSTFIMQGRLILEVNAIEEEGLSVSSVLGDLLTKVTLEETALGYQYLIEQN